MATHHELTAASATREWDAVTYDRASRFDTRAALEEYLATVVLGAHLEHRSPSEQRSPVRAVAAGLPGPVVDYVRLDVVATNGGS